MVFDNSLEYSKMYLDQAVLSSILAAYVYLHILLKRTESYQVAVCICSWRVIVQKDRVFSQ